MHHPGKPQSTCSKLGKDTAVKRNSKGELYPKIGLKKEFRQNLRTNLTKDLVS